MRVRGRYLALGQVKGLDEFGVAEADNGLEALLHLVDTTHQRVRTAEADTGAMIALLVEEAGDLVALAVRGSEVDPDGAARLAPAQHLVELIRPQRKGAAKQRETDTLADAALAGLVVTGDADESLCRDIIDLEYRVLEDVFRMDAVDNHGQFETRSFFFTNSTASANSSASKSS